MRHPHVATLALLILALSIPQRSAAEAAGPAPRTFGTSATVSHTIQAFSFGGLEAFDVTLFTYVQGARLCSGLCFTAAGLLLPAGALVVAVELDACDTDAAGEVTFALSTTAKAAGAVTGLVAGTTGIAATPGCTTVTAAPAAPVTIDNANANYWVEVDLRGGTPATRFQAVRVLYALQVSPAPASATFGDVPPSHPFFQYVEALVASGITAGCSAAPPLYCPDAPLSRGQMAVFLSKALGLHFAP